MVVVAVVPHVDQEAVRHVQVLVQVLDPGAVQHVQVALLAQVAQVRDLEAARPSNPVQSGSRSLT